MTTDNKQAFANITPEERERNSARSRASKTNIHLVKQRLAEIADDLWEEYANAEAGEVLHPNAALLYALVGYPWDEYDDGSIERNEERFRGAAAKYFEAPDLSWIVEDEDQLITLQEATFDDNGDPIVIIDDEGKKTYETHDIEVPLADAVRIYGLGFKPNGTTAKSGIEVEWLLTLQPKVGKSRAAAVVEASGIRPSTKLGSLYRVQYYDLLIQSGAEEVDDEEVEEEEVFEDTADDAADAEDNSNDLDAAAADFDDAADDVDDVDDVDDFADDADADVDDADDDDADDAE